MSRPRKLALLTGPEDIVRPLAYALWVAGFTTFQYVMPQFLTPDVTLECTPDAQNCLTVRSGVPNDHPDWRWPQEVPRGDMAAILEAVKRFSNRKRGPKPSVGPSAGHIVVRESKQYQRLIAGETR